MFKAKVPKLASLCQYSTAKNPKGKLYSHVTLVDFFWTEVEKGYEFLPPLPEPPAGSVTFQVRGIKADLPPYSDRA